MPPVSLVRATWLPIVLLFAGCSSTVNLAPAPPPVVAAVIAPLATPVTVNAAPPSATFAVAAASGVAPPAAPLLALESNRAAARAVAPMTPPADLWERIQRGYAMPNLESELVREREQWYATRPDYLQRMGERGRKYLFHIVEELERRSMPTELALLPFIESAFNPQAVSSAKAAGMWQFMPATGKHFELKQNAFRDDRRDVLASTRAALDYLQKLHGMFGDWHLATASYNAGEGRVKRALRGAESQDYFAVSEARRLPNETRNYVPKLMAAMIISKNPTKFGFDVAEGSRALKSRTVRVEKSVSLAELAQSISVNPSVLENLNPELRVGITPPARATEKGFYEVRVPDQSYDAAVAAIDSLPEASRVQRVAAKVRKAETVSHFARRNGITLASLQSTNPGLKAGTRLRRGQTLLVPVTLGSGSYEKMVNDADSKKKKKVNYARATRRLRGKSARARSQSEATRTNTVKTKSVIERRNKRR